MTTLPGGIGLQSKFLKKRSTKSVSDASSSITTAIQLFLSSERGDRVPIMGWCSFGHIKQDRLAGSKDDDMHSLVGVLHLAILAPMKVSPNLLSSSFNTPNLPCESVPSPDLRHLPDLDHQNFGLGLLCGPKYANSLL